MSELPPFDLGPLPATRDMSTVDERLVHAPLPVIFNLAAAVERWRANRAALDELRAATASLG